MQKSLSYYRQLLENYLDNSVSAIEANELFDFIKQQPEEAGKLMNEFRDVDQSERFKQLENIDDATSRRMYNRLLGSIQTPAAPALQAPVHRVHFLRSGWFRYAAAVLLLAGCAGTYFLLNNGKAEKGIASGKNIQTDIGAGGNKAILTLDDGRKIMLDEAQNGDLARQGSTRVVKQENGRLAYETDGAQDGKIASNTLTVPRGGQYALTLSDGTKVWLNAASSITYPNVFTGTDRKVEISGEAYLEIAKNERKPFKVKANGAEILVLGTSFNVNAYTDENAVKTTLVDGSVKVVKSSTSQAKMLIPGQQAEISESTEGVKVETVDTDQVLAWKNGLFSFNNADIKTVMRQLSRWYDITIVYENGVPAQRFYGDMNRNLTLSQVLKGLEVTKVNFRLEGRNLIVMP
ncbi:MAG: FecR domain-containing protein [Chitinophagaceae bacterium]|nr:FecR domain-containing protein [Chitinophagaceae bacterium]